MEASLLDLVKVSVIVGIIYGIGTIGLSLIYKYIKFPDFTTLASVSISGIACIVVSKYSCITFGIIAGIGVSAVLGLITGLQILLKIPAILAGIITSVGATTIGFWINGNNADAFFGADRTNIDLILSDTFTLGNLFRLIILTLIISLFISRFFRTKYGAYTLAITGSDHFLQFRHRKKNLTQIVVIIIGNSIIGLAGALAAIQNGSSNVQVSHNDFLIIALGGYTFGSFMINVMSRNAIFQYLKQDDKLSSPWYLKILLFTTRSLRLNDEDPRRIFITQLFYVFFAMLINIVFRSVEIKIGVNDNFLVKAFILFAVLWLSTLTDRFSKQV